MKTIPLTQGKVTLVDDKDYDRVQKFKWQALETSPGLWYAVHGFGRSSLFLHRYLLKATPNQECDHVNGNGLDNRCDNLRLCSKSQNIANSRKTRSYGGHPTSSEYKGVNWHKARRKWIAYITVQYRRKHLGYFTTEVEAALAYDAAARQYFGEYAHPNFPAGDN